MNFKRMICKLTAICLISGTFVPWNNVFAEDEADTLFYEPFNYTRGQSISQSSAAANGWSVTNEGSIPSGQGSSSLVTADPENSGNSVLDIETFTTTYTSKNRYAVVNGTYNANGKRYIEIKKKVKITTTSDMKGKYIFYVNGSYANASTGAVTAANAEMLYFTYDMQSSKFGHELGSGYETLSTMPSALPGGSWVEMKFVIDCTAQTYDMYVNGTKQNDESLPLRNKRSGEVVTGIRTIQFGPNRWLGLSSHYYIDDLTVSAYDGVTVPDKDRIDNMRDTLTAYTFSGQKYVMESFTPNLSGRISTDTVTVTASDSAVSYNSAANRVVITRGSEDKIVNVTVNVASAGGNSFTKTLKFYVPSASIVGLYEGFDYPSLVGKSISGADNWSFGNENTDLSKTGSTNYVEADPDDASNLVMDTHVYRTYSANQYTTLSQGTSIMGDTVLQANIRFDAAVNQYIWYVYGTVKTSSGELSKELLELYLKQGDGKLECKSAGASVTVSTNPFPTGEWFNLKIVIHTTENSFDIYRDNVKLNGSPLDLAEVTSGGTVTKIGAMNFGATRWSGSSGHMYLDDIMIRYNAAAVLETEAEMLDIPDTLIYDYTLPTTGIYDGTTISWSSANASVLSSSGKVNRNIGFGETVVRLTATIEAGGATREKNIDVKVVNTPYYTIDSLVFENAGGDEVYSAVAGGKLKSMFVTKYTTDTADNATAYIVVYDENGKIAATSAPKRVTATGEIPINVQLPNVAGMYAKAFIWNSANLKPLAYTYSTKLASGATVYSIGDSTMQSYDTIEARRADNRMTGWAQVLPLAVKNNSVALDNRAVAGTSTLSFYNLGYIHPIYENIKPGDYLLIQFGHNDEKPWISQDAAKNYSPLEPVHQLHPKATEVPDWAKDRKTYEQWLREYAAAARMKGAQVIFATSIYRHFFEENGDAAYSHYGYPEAMVDTAAETGTPVIDLCTITGEWLQELGQANSLKYYLAFHGGDDHTHLTYDGAVEIANMALDELRNIGHPLADAFTQVPAR